MHRISRTSPTNENFTDEPGGSNNQGFRHQSSYTPQRPDVLNFDAKRGTIGRAQQQMRSSAAHQTPSFGNPRPMSGSFQTPASLSSRQPSHTVRDASAHRNRLVTLRERMNKEFGNRQLGGPSSSTDYEHDETMSTASDALSLHSWHHNIIGRNETVVVRASDTLSSCAAPRSEMLSPSPNSTMPPINENTSFDNQRSRSSTWTPSGSTCSGVSPTPRIPPPVPARGPVSSPLNSPLAYAPVSPMPRCPPPLPPRTHAMKLPDPVAVEVENRLEEERLKKNGLQREFSAGSSTTSGFAGWSTPASSIQHVESKTHKKTTSFDRAFLSGHLQSTDTKTNEQEKQGLAAEDVVREITTNFETAALHANQNHLDATSLETIPSASNSSVSSRSSRSSKEEISISIPRPRDIDTILEEAPTSSKSQSAVVSIENLSPAKPISNRCSRSMSNDELRTTKSDKLSSSVDPVTLDVERRLSMKRSGQHEPDQHSIGSLDETTSHRTLSRTSIGNAASFARNSVRYASGMLRGAFKRVRTAARPGTSSSSRHEIGEETSDGEESDEPQHSVAPSNIVRPRKNKKGPFDFENLAVEQELNNEHTGAIWCIKFSICGKLMATAGQDAILRIWVVRSHLQYFSEMREKYSGYGNNDSDPMVDNIEQFRPPSSMGSVVNSETTTSSDENTGLFCAKPFAVLKGHTADILDVSWSKNYFVLSSGMDRTVKLWHLSRNECLCCFQHIDFVTCVAFLPKDDRYFLSGSLDGKLRMWHIPDKKVAVWNDTEKKYITAMTFVKNGKFAVVGTYDGKCIFYTSDQLKYHTAVDVRSTRGKNARGHKVTGLTSHGDKLLVTSNDSRIRMYDIRDKALTCKFKGVQNDHSQIRAAFSPDGRHIICGSEDKFVYIWRATDISTSLSVRKDRNSWWERVRTHNAPVPVAVFAPRPQVFFNMLSKREKHSKNDSIDFNVAQSDSLTSNGNLTIPGHVIVSADLAGVIKVMINRPRLVKANPLESRKSSRGRSSVSNS